MVVVLTSQENSYEIFRRREVVIVWGLCGDCVVMVMIVVVEVIVVMLVIVVLVVIVR